MEKIKKFLARPQVWGFFVSIALMAIISLAFFYPDNFEGNSLRQPDMQQGAANGHEAQMWEEETGEKALWTNSLFGGMPTFQISPSYPSNSLFNWINTVYGLGLPSPSNLLFMMMMGFFILMYALKKEWYYSLIGAVAWGFSSYFVIIIGAGHIWKFVALAYVPPTIAGLILVYRGRRWVGAALIALFAMLQLNANHPQMTYYFGLTMAILALAFLVSAIKTKKLKQWCVATAVILLCGALAIGANAPSLYNTYEYSKATKRAQSELTPLVDDVQENMQAERPTGGLPKSQIVGWSYGRGEMLSLLIPNIKGGASARPAGGQMVPTSLAELTEDADNASPLLHYMTQYFNDSEGTNGPVYVGAIVLALFLLGCFIVRGPLKWGLVAATVISVLLALGANFEALTDFMIYNFPMYNKFRAVESILVVAEFSIPLLGILALAQLFEDGKASWVKYKKYIAFSFGVPAFVCVLFLLFPSLTGSAITDTDRYYASMIQQQAAAMYQQNGYNDQQIASALYEFSLSNPAVRESIESLRYGMVKDDALRSFGLLALAAVFIWLFLAGKMKKGLALAIVGVLIMSDLYSVDKRYVSHASFGSPVAHSNQGIEADEIDLAIMADTTGHYRVFDIPGFDQARRSYFHNMVGGYHAAKLNRYEDIIQRRLNAVRQYGYMRDSSLINLYGEEGATVVNGALVADMLNSRYIITGNQESPVIYNPNAFGNAWLAEEIKWVDNADEEMAALDVRSTDLKRQAIVDRKFKDAFGPNHSVSSGDTVYLEEYTPNKLTYRSVTTSPCVGVFSEVWFPWGWNAQIDGKDVPMARANYILRALEIPAGKHEIVMTFEPSSIKATSAGAYACITLIYLLVVTAIFAACRQSRIF